MQTRVGGVARMSLPDATRSDRVYPLLQNLDLENLAFATVQGVGNTLAIEEMNEDELRRLVLVNLARLTVSGEWNGLLTAGGGGGGFSLVPYSSSAYGEDAEAYIMANAPYAAPGAGYGTGPIVTDQWLWPFVSTNSGDVSTMTISVSVGAATSSAICAIYSITDGLPSTLLGYADIITTAAGDIAQTSFSATITLEAGTTYYYGIRGIDGGSGLASLRNIDESGTPSIGLGDGFAFITGPRGICFDTNAATTPSTLVVSAATFEEHKRVGLALKFA